MELKEEDVLVEEDEGNGGVVDVVLRGGGVTRRAGSAR